MTTTAQKFSAHKSDAKRRGISFRLTFDEWLDIWLASGHWAQRGNRGGHYVMARYGDCGAYEVGNVRIILFEENSRERRLSRAAKKRIGAAHQGKTVSTKTRQKLSTKAAGRVHSLAARSKMSRSQKYVVPFRVRDGYGRFA